MNTNEIVVSRRIEAFAYLSKFDCLADSLDSINVTQWSNRDGYTISIYKKNGENILIELSEGELAAINFLTNKIKYELEDKFPNEELPNLNK